MNKQIASPQKIKLLRYLKKKFEDLINFFIKLIFQIKAGNNSKFGVIISEAFYQPWNEDKYFKYFYKSILGLTMLDKSRLYILYQVVKNIKKIKGDIIEVGTWRGGSAIMMALTLRKERIRKTIYTFDTFSGVIKSTKLDTYYKGTEHKNADQIKLLKILKKKKIKNLISRKGIFPDDLKKMNLKINKISVAHLDVDTYQSLKDSFEFIWKKLSIGGLIICDDYGFHQTEGARQYLKKVSELKKNIFIPLTNGQCIIVKNNE